MSQANVGKEKKKEGLKGEVIKEKFVCTAASAQD